MIITEAQFFSDTKGDNKFSVLFEKVLADAFKKTLYIFISHKHNEVNHVYRLQEILGRYGFTGYVDWEDDNMPPTTSGETAVQLKDRIVKARKFILIATEAAIESKWCNWEVGFADAHKYEDHLALLPIKPDQSQYKGEEYLQIYPSIQIRSESLERSQLSYYVQYPNGKEISLKNWLTI
ncbi:hypothetical protein A3860_23700 [Niastella vici]|uniref:TIR domain-containing protein n=1 Tax=Niastella vici TaxID=1703345 RepID=A0A1V9FYG1_9BACT|nr:toll/interleukin-1 receptor domain-containing protein [Niastella vici]OQP63357.1 hypothetical protein A3860_23700 [Niastella vici]